MKYTYTRLFALSVLVLCFSLKIAAQPIVISTQVSAITCGGCDGMIDLTVTGGTPPYAFDWSGLPGTNNPQDLSNICAGVYTVTVTDASGITQSASVTVTQPAPLVISICPTNVTCFGANNGSIDLSVTGGVGPYTYLWSNGATTQDLSNMPAGTYTPTITDANGCTKTIGVTITQPLPITINGDVINSSNGNNDGAIDLTITGGTPAYTAIWSNGNFGIDISNLTPGTYTTTVTDATGCTKSQSFTIQGNGGSGSDPLQLNGQASNSGCGANCSGSITITINNGLSPYSYHWTGPNGFAINGSTANTTFVTGQLCAGNYCVTVSSGGLGTSATACYTVGQGSTQQNLKIQSSNSAFCNFNQGGNSSLCEMVCPNTSVTYFVDPPVNCGNPMNLGTAVWTVSGAESYIANGNEVSVKWGDAGPGLVEFASNTQSLCFASQHCVTVLEEPKAQFSTEPPSVPNTVLQLCKGQTVAFKNESLNAEIYEWLFSDDLSVLSTENPQHTFLTPGNFSVTLIARSNCLCADTTVLLIEVLDSEPPLLDCVGSVCPGETVTYSTSSNCSAYTWLVSPNGSVVQGGQSGDNTITIQWGDGPVGSISLSASGCAGSACPQASIFNISIISDNAEIRGNAFVCPQSEEEYSIDLFDGTEYVWTLLSGGNILRGQGTNKVAIAWTAQANANLNHWLIVDYYNCYLGCGGTDSIPVKILAPFYIDGPVEMCEGATKNYLARNASTNAGVNCNWSVFDPNGALVSSSSGTNLSFTPSAGDGNYRLFAVPSSPDQSCSSSAELKVSVVARPQKPIAIDGPKIVCPGAALQYEVPGNPPYEIEWKTGNGTPAIQTGNPVNVTWNTNPTHWISAAQISLDGLGCKSDTTRLDIQNAASISISGPISACEGAVLFYQADYYEGFEYQWDILPASAGTLKQGQGKSNVEVFWQTPGTHQLRVTTCGLTTTFNITIWANPVPVPIAPEGLCPGALGSVSVNGTFQTYAWAEADGTALGNAASMDIPNGAYTLEVTDIHGCKGTSEFSIDPLPTPNVSVTTAQPAGFCNNSILVSLTALVPEAANFDYQWLHDGVPIGTNSVVYSTNQYGLYTVMVTNEHGCTATAPPILLFEYCLPDCGGVCPNPTTLCPPGTVQGVPDLTPRCDSFRMVLNDYSGLYVPGSAKWWTGISGTAGWEFATGDSVHFEYPNAGKYIVVVKVLLSTGEICASVDSLDVEAVAQFSQKLACPGDSTFFQDESTRLPEAGFASWTWDFGLAGNADVSSLPSPGYPYANAGNYTATLTVTTTTGCTSSYSENVFVPDLPAPAFAPPLANCAGNAAQFVLSNSAGIIKTVWDFGDPGSGALNQTEANPGYHNYSPAGNYPVSVTTTNTYGCTSSVTQPVNITANPFSGVIFPPTSTICQGSSLNLSAPLGPGAMYVWNDASNLPTLLVTEEGVYDVTLTNANGCSYSPPEKAVDVNPAPIGTIKFLEINDLGQIVGVQYPEAAVCAGDDVTLQIQDNGNYTYNWSGGNGNDAVLTFSEDRGNLLSVGTHTFSVTLTNPATGCTAVLPPFTVTVNPVPNNFSLSTNNVCAGTPSTITYSGPQPPEWQIFWNTGEAGPSLVTEESGLYFVRVINEFGCSAQSNTVVIFPGPNISALPSGCHERCDPDTLCLPPLPEIVNWQWFFEGMAIPGATSNQFAATQSGTYWAELVDVNGCEATSAPLTVSLYDGFGNVLGQVWSDVNDNGIIDGPDTLVSGIPVQLLQNGALVSPNQSGPNGDFSWLNVFSTNYSVQLDSQLLGSLWEIVIFSDSVRLSGCGGKVFAQLLVDSYTCPPLLGNVTISACPGETATYNGVSILAGQSQQITYQSLLGCDSIITVNVVPLPVSSSSFSASVCPGDVYTYNGVDLAVGQSQNFTLSNWQGCDSIVTVSVSALPVSSSSLNASVCPGDVYTYNGVDLVVGQSQNFTLSNWQGCDSIVTVSVSALPVSSSSFSASVCPGDVYTYNGVDLAVGQSQDFTLSNWQGCDSIVTVSVSALTVSSSAISMGVCPNETITYQGQALAAGDVQTFTLSNALGCDSLVTVTVFEKATSAEIREVKVCPGEVYTFNNQSLAAGETREFKLLNSEGCDSTITISVSAWPALSFEVKTAVSCPNLANGSLSIQVVSGAGNLYYSLNAIDFQSSADFGALPAGNYTVYVRDANNCVFEQNTVIPASPGLELELPAVHLIPCESQEITLQPFIGGDTTGLQMLWWNGAQTPTVSLQQAESVWLEVSNHCESLRRESQVSWADSEGEPILIYVPNIFAPKADLTENAMFRAFFGHNLRLLSYRLEVYDRWGNFIFETETPEDGWLGKMGVTNTGTDVFVWQMWARVSFCGREIEIYKKGDVTVVR